MRSRDRQARGAPGRARAEGEEVTKTPGEFEPPKPISKAERDARKAFRQGDAKKAMTEHEIEQKAFSANRERLKGERLAREAVELKAKASNPVLNAPRGLQNYDHFPSTFGPAHRST